MARYALIKDGVVQNVILADDEGWVTQYAADAGYTAANVDTFEDVVGPGFVHRADGSFAHPEELAVDVGTIPPDGTTAATLTYKDNRADPPAEVDGTVNGTPVAVTLDASGSGTLQVTSTNAGDTVTVVLGGVSAAIKVVAP